MIYLTADHGGVALKARLKDYLEKHEIHYIDLGPFEIDPADDYPIYAKKLAEAVVANKGKGIGICRSGVGMAIMANKMDGIRAVEAYTVEEACLAREKNDTNVLVIGADDFKDENGWEIIQTWLTTKFSGEERHLRRIGEIEEYEQEN